MLIRLTFIFYLVYASVISPWTMTFPTHVSRMTLILFLNPKLLNSEARPPSKTRKRIKPHTILNWIKATTCLVVQMDH